MPYPYEDIEPGGWSALMPRVKMQTSIYNMVILQALKQYMAYEWRLPKNMVELLNSPYSAVSAEHLVEPVAGLPYSRLKEGQMLTHWYTFQDTGELNTSTVTTTYYVRDPETREPVATQTTDPAISYLPKILPFGFSRDGPWCPIRYDRTSVDLRGVTAEAVEHALDTGVAEFYRHHRRRPKSHAEMVATFPFLEKLKNPYTGEFARLEGSGPRVSATVPEGNPGNFYFLEDPDLPGYQVFGTEAGSAFSPRLPATSCSPEAIKAIQEGEEIRKVIRHNR
ncbi:MAG: hypothetical protein V2G51_06435 [bacterium JZ-2024 1]